MTSPMTSNGRKVAHDLLLSQKPEGASHDPDGCPLCAMEDPASGGGTMTYTEEELQAKVDEAVRTAVAERDSKIAELTAAHQTTETDKAVAAAVAEKEKEIADLRTELDKSVLEAGNATAERDGILAWLEAEKTASEEREAAAARRDTRLAKLKEVASFPDEYLQSNADRFAAMSDEEFDARCAEYAALSTARSTEVPAGMPGMKAGLESTSTGTTSAVKGLLALRREAGHVSLSNL